MPVSTNGKSNTMPAADDDPELLTLRG